MINPKTAIIPRRMAAKHRRMIRLTSMVVEGLAMRKFTLYLDSRNRDFEQKQNK
jgi:hypothetical protein